RRQYLRVSRAPPPRPRLTLFPYTTLFRSHEDVTAHRIGADQAPRRSRQPVEAPAKIHRLRRDVDPHRGRQRQHAPSSTASTRSRSEEHTSELQSRENLVCRLLLEKKKTKA